MKKMMRLLVLTYVVLLSTLGTSEAAPGDCHVECAGGYSYVIPMSLTYEGFAQCCEEFRERCGSSGSAYLEFDPQEASLYCPS